MKKVNNEPVKLYEYDFTEIQFNIEDACFYIHSFHQRENSYIFNHKILDSLTSGYAIGPPAPHTHPYYEVFSPRYDQCQIEIDGKMYYPNIGDLIIISPHTKHVLNSAKENGLIVFNFSFRKNSLKTENSLHKILSENLSAPYLYIENRPEFCELIDRFMQNVDDGNYFMISNSFFNILVEIIDSCGKNLITNPDSMLTDSSINRYRKIQTLIRFFYTENLTLESIAKNLNLSLRQTSRIIKEEFGCTFHELITKKRMETAKKLLKETNMKIIDIASEVGYDSTMSFYNAFKKYFNCLPKEMRNK